MIDPTTVKLGKKLGVVNDPRTFHLRTLLTPDDLPRIPTHWRMARALRDMPMFANDRYGCCTLASQGHRIVGQEHASRQHEVTPTDADILEAYSAVTGFNPLDPGTDNGAYMLDVANYMRRTGIGREKDGTRHTIDAFVKVDHLNQREVETACNLFGGVWVGVWLPNSAKAQTHPQGWWDVSAAGLQGDGAPGSWGGHAITVNGYGVGGPTAWTWGAEQRMTWHFWNAYVDEAWAIVSEDWLRRSGTTVRGFDAEQLRAWLAELG
jgi:hypothetical protein